MPLRGHIGDHRIGIEVGRVRRARERLQIHRVCEHAVSPEGQAGNAGDAEHTVSAQIAHDHRRRRDAQSAEEDLVGIILEDVAATVEDSR